MTLDSTTWRRLLSRLCVAILIAWSLSCGSNPSQPTDNNKNTPPACTVRLWACTSKYGAIAYSPSTRASGIAYDWGSRAEAESSAIGYCAKGDCYVAAWFSNSCGAIAVAPTGQMATGTGSTGDTAQAFALATCLAR